MSLVDEASKLLSIEAEGKLSKAYTYEEELNAYYTEVVSIVDKNLENIREYCYKHPCKDTDHSKNLYGKRKTGLFSSEQYLVASYVTNVLLECRAESIYADDKYFMAKDGHYLGNEEALQWICHSAELNCVFDGDTPWNGTPADFRNRKDRNLRVPVDFSDEKIKMPDGKLELLIDHFDDLVQIRWNDYVLGHSRGDIISIENLIKDYLRISPEERVRQWMQKLFEDRE